ncbi:maleate cis-trans isomerase family protein [Labrys wisconsinensis]|uniref:Maleate isomerase n=1 Tax=Labrys wisconsinensis TaxID=425677 RepID=A0ABU0J7T4_9HYPH|nr:aspartate/glutamate racemase family protein [Labrys wisconsinensis]MDQ0470334.1 maleate isomerase [Labrys wisconsinensis]
MTATRVKRLGMLAPSSNTVLEPETARLLPADGSVTAHVSRLRVVTISPEADSLGQFELGRVLAAAELLADAKVDLILWNGTAASWLGFDHDARMVAAIEAHTGIPATTAVLAINAALARIGARRIGLVTPYVEALEERIIANYRGIGIETAAAVRLDLTENTAYAAVSPQEIAAMARRVAAGPADAVLILCTNLAGASVAPDLAAELGVPVLDSVRVAVEHSLSLLGQH